MSDVAILFRTPGDKSNHASYEVCSMRQSRMKKYPAALKARAVQLAVESDQAIAQTARDLGVNEHTLHTWSGTYHRPARQEQEGHDAHLYEELRRLRKENARFKEERDILKKATASFAQQLPCRTPGDSSSTRHFGCAVWVGCWRSPAGVLTHGAAVCPRRRRWRLVSASPLRGSSYLRTVAVRRGLTAIDSS